MQIKLGNTVVLLFSVMDTAGNAITNLSTASAVKFMVKLSETDLDTAAKISKSLGSGITIDTPNVGNVAVTLTATDTNLVTAGQYFMALQIEWTASKQEVTIKQTFDAVDEINSIQFIQDIIR